MKRKDLTPLTGKRFGSLIVIGPAEQPKNIKQRNAFYYLCSCDCGFHNCYKTSIVRKDHLTSGNTTSCKANKRALTTVEDIKKSAFRGIWSRGKYNDADITPEQFISLATSNCFYCEVGPKTKINDFIKNKGTAFSKEHGEIFYNGLDRIDSSLPHLLSNVIPCCPICNSFKLARSYNQVLEHIPLLNDDFVPIFTDALHKVKDKLELLKQGIGIKSETARTPLAKLYPETYNKGNRSYLQHRISIFFSMIRQHKIDCDLSEIDVAELILANCIYCNSSPDLNIGKFNGIDRFICSDKNGKIGYLKNNCVPACEYCNSAKRELSVEDFRGWMVRIKNNILNLPRNEQELDQYIKNRIIL